jgi:hypothetical protein
MSNGEGKVTPVKLFCFRFRVLGRRGKANFRAECAKQRPNSTPGDRANGGVWVHACKGSRLGRVQRFSRYGFVSLRGRYSLEQFGERTILEQIVTSKFIRSDCGRCSALCSLTRFVIEFGLGHSRECSN